MPTYRFEWPTGYAAHMTTVQYDKACQIAKNFNLPSTVVVSPVFGIQGAIGIDTGIMHIAILEDGSSHS